MVQTSDLIFRVPHRLEERIVLAATGCDWLRPAATDGDRRRLAATGCDRRRQVVVTGSGDRRRPTAETGGGDQRQRRAADWWPTGDNWQRMAATGRDQPRLATTGGGQRASLQKKCFSNPKEHIKNKYN